MFEKYNNRITNGDKNRTNMLPVFAWQLDNSRDISETELRINVDRIHLETASFKNFSMKSGHNIKALKEIIIDVVNTRGKLHNPYTDTGGIVSGRIEKIGDRCKNPQGFMEGDEVIVLVSTTMFPLHIEQIIDIDFALEIIVAEGYFIISDECTLVKRPNNISLAPLMLAMEESASLLRIYEIAKTESTFFIVGKNPIISYLYACSIRKAVGKNGMIVGLLCDADIDERLDSLLKKTFDVTYYQNSLTITECTNLILEDHKSLFDLSIDCAEEIHAEAINILMTKEKGTVFMSNMVNHCGTVALITEALEKDLNILGCVGYISGYEWFNLSILNDHADDIEKITRIYQNKKKEKNKKSTSKKDKADLVQTNSLILYNFIYESASMESLINEIEKAAKYDSPVLIIGESGTGKEKITEILHNNSKRMMGPCVNVNCASTPANLFESEFFGYDKGAFTGANAAGKAGYFELSDQGTLFLDEISELPLEQQAKLLRVLQDKKYYRVGGTQPVFTDFRIIAASNKNLKEMVEKGTFRADLYYRLAVLVISVPALRDRKEDIIPLAKFLFNKYCTMYSIQKHFSEDAFNIFLNYDWPGNIREMENVIQRVLVNIGGELITEEMVMKEMNRDKLLNDEHHFDRKGSLVYKEFMKQQEEKYIKSALIKFKTTRNAAAALGISQTQFMRLKKKYCL